MKVADENTIRAIAAYTGPVTRCPPGEAGASAELTVKLNKAVEWLKQHRCAKPLGGSNWRLTMPVFFLHAEYDYVCETVGSHFAKPMRAHCANLTEAVVRSGHWMAQEKPRETNALLAKWLAAQLPTLWPLPDE